MKILILGAKGMLGNDLVKTFSEEELTAWDVNDLDITDEKAVDEKISTLQPEIVINAAAYTDVDGAESNKELCFKINAYAVGNIAKACSKINASLVHISTDYIFDGKKEGYSEDDVQNPIGVYGASKALSEKLILENTDKYFIVRTSWLYGVNGKNFVETMLRLGKEKDSIDVVNDQFGCPTYTKDLALKIKEIIEKPFGIYHVTNDASCSWYDFAKKIFELSGMKTKVNPVTTDKFPRPAQRPKFSILLSTKISKPRNWEDALKEYLEVRT